MTCSRDGRMLAGVCAGAASYPGADVTLVQMIRAAASLTSGGAGVLACLAAWALTPDGGQNRSITENLTSTEQARMDRLTIP